MDNYKFYFSRRIAEDKICDAKTPEQVKAAMRKSCELCQKAGQYNPRWHCYGDGCSVKNFAKAKLRNLTPNNSRVIIRTTRKYNRKGVAQRLLTNAAKRVVAYSQELAIDDASVFVELGDYESAYRVLKRNGLDDEAQALKKAIKGGD